MHVASLPSVGNEGSYLVNEFRQINIHITFYIISPLLSSFLFPMGSYDQSVRKIRYSIVEAFFDVRLLFEVCDFFWVFQGYLRYIFEYPRTVQKHSRI